jgi:threonyl-tRNA synthetase
MPAITLPDGSQRKYDKHVTVLDVAADIGRGLAKTRWPAKSTSCATPVI